MKERTVLGIGKCAGAAGGDTLLQAIGSGRAGNPHGGCQFWGEGTIEPVATRYSFRFSSAGGSSDQQMK